MPSLKTNSRQPKQRLPSMCSLQPMSLEWQSVLQVNKVRKDVGAGFCHLKKVVHFKITDCITDGMTSLVNTGDMGWLLLEMSGT